MQKINPSGCLTNTSEAKNHTFLMITGKHKVSVKNQEKLRMHFSFWLTLILALTMSSCNQSSSWSPDPGEFNQPGSLSSIHAWWHWVDNAITREGITADLEAMKKAGIVSSTILNVSLFQEKDLGVSPVIFDSPEWHGMFRWALEEANRLSLTLGVHNCDGWSTSGGPWITPELSMKKCVWTKTYASGGSMLAIQLQEPDHRGQNPKWYPQRPVDDLTLRKASRTRHAPQTGRADGAGGVCMVGKDIGDWVDCANGIG